MIKEAKEKMKEHRDRDQRAGDAALGSDPLLPLDTRNELSVGRDAYLQWFGFVAPPVVFLTDLLLKYSMVQEMCETGSRVLFFVVTLVALAICVLSFLGERAVASRLGDDAGEELTATVLRSRFMTAAGSAMSLFFVLAILANAMPTIFLSPCDH